jgi:hypothetical protein
MLLRTAEITGQAVRFGFSSTKAVSRFVVNRTVSQLMLVSPSQVLREHNNELPSLEHARRTAAQALGEFAAFSATVGDNHAGSQAEEMVMTAAVAFQGLGIEPNVNALRRLGVPPDQGAMIERMVQPVLDPGHYGRDPRTTGGYL